MYSDNMKNDLTKAGAQYCLSRSINHPSSFIFLNKDKKEFDLDKVVKSINTALEAIKSVTEKKGVILFITSRYESRDALKELAESFSMPFVVGRFVGGTISNFNTIKNRIEEMNKLMKEKEDGEWDLKFSKKEKLMRNRKLEKLQNRFLGISNLKSIPNMVFVIDSAKEGIAVKEANDLSIPVVSITNSNSNIKKIDYPIVLNCSSIETIKFVLDRVRENIKTVK